MEQEFQEVSLKSKKNQTKAAKRKLKTNPCSLSSVVREPYAAFPFHGNSSRHAISCNAVNVKDTNSHGASNCKMIYRYLKCKPKHGPGNCIKTPEEAPICVKCNYTHTANIRRCNSKTSLVLIPNERVQLQLVRKYIYRNATV